MPGGSRVRHAIPHRLVGRLYVIPAELGIGPRAAQGFLAAGMLTNQMLIN